MKKRKKHIIIFRLSALGDVAMIVPVLLVLVKQHPEVKITVVSRGFLQPLFEDIKNVSFFTAKVNTEHKGFFGLWKLFKQLLQLKPTHFADLHNVLRATVIRFFFSIYGYKTAVINKGRAEKKALIRTRNKVFKQLKTTHQRYAEVFVKLGFPIQTNQYTPVKQIPLFKKVKDIVGYKNNHWIGIAPFATHIYKEYPLDLMEVVIKQLSEKKVRVFLFGGKDDVKKLETISKKYKNVQTVAQKLGGLKNELNLIANLDVMLSMDSANAHFSAIYNIKTITLWGATHPFAGFAPYNQPADYCLVPDIKKYPNLPCSIYGNKTCIGYENVMLNIMPEEIAQKIFSAL